MWDIVWVSPRGHKSVSVSRHFPSAGTAVSLFRAKTVKQRPRTVAEGGQNPVAGLWGRTRES